MSVHPLHRDGDVDGSEVQRLAAVARTLREKNQQLEHALESRIVIEQAKGILAERLDVSVEVAFTVLRRAARSNRLRIHALAEEVVSSRATPAAIRAALE